MKNFLILIICLVITSCNFRTIPLGIPKAPSFKTKTFNIRITQRQFIFKKHDKIRKLRVKICSNAFLSPEGINNALEKKMREEAIKFRANAVLSYQIEKSTRWASKCHSATGTAVRYK